MFDELATRSGPVIEPAVAMKSEATLRSVDKVVIAIHGIGSQQRSATIRSVARRFGEREKDPLPVMPLGYFNVGKTGEVHLSRLDAPDDSELRGIGFAEVFWADIPRQVVKEGDTLEETKAWGASVVSRAHDAYRRKVTSNQQLDAADFQLCADVIDEVVETVAVLEKLLAVTEKMGIFKFDLAPILRDHIGDVQIVAEFAYYRQLIVARFHNTIAQIVAECGSVTPEIYLIAHSEGSVVSFLGLLQALSGDIVRNPEKGNAVVSTEWITQVRGFMTIGSPIDKHLVLWEKMWDGLELRSKRTESGSVVFGADGHERLRLARPIQWRNYYDYGDPIGFRLETAVEWLGKHECAAFEFDEQKDNIGFSRYWFPGKAHTGYWGDADVFRHFIDDVVNRVPGPPDTPPVPKPKSKWPVDFVSTAIPYLLSAVLHLGAVFVLFKAVTVFITESIALQSVARLKASPPDALSGLKEFSAQVVLLGVLLLGVTVAARLPRLVKTRAGWRWHVLALLAFAAAAIPNWLWLPEEVADFLGKNFLGLAALFKASEDRDGIVTVLLAAALVAASGWLVRRRTRFARHWLMGAGALVVSVMVVGRMNEVASHESPSVWPVVLASLAFFYLWWLGILLFDLAFIWHRYIRQSVAVRTLSEWHRGQDARPETLFKKSGNDRR